MKTVYYGGKILTMGNENRYAEAVLVHNGIIKKVGSLKQVLEEAGHRAKKKNLNGACLMPSFIDTHSHIVMNGQMSIFADLSNCSSFKDIKTVMMSYIKENSLTNKQIAVGFGYDHNFLKEETHPDKDVLDEVSKDIPIILLHVSGHLGCVNSEMLKIANITSKTQNPSGGKIGRKKNSDEPNGYLEESAILSVQQIIVKRIKPNLKKVIYGMQRSYIENGVTTVQDGATNDMTIKLLKIINFLNLLKIDIVSYPLLSSGGRQILLKNLVLKRKYKRHLKIGGYKIILDGSPQGRSAWMSEPYLGGEENYCGYPWLNDDTVFRYTLDAMNDNMPLLAHCNGDAASEQFLSAYEKALSHTSNNNKAMLRPVMIHCQTVRNDQLDRMANLNMIPSIFVGHVYYWGDIHMKNFGEQRGNHISPAKDAIERKLCINFHQDTPVTKPSALFSVWCAVNRVSRLGNIIGASQKIEVFDALKAVTINAAYEYFEEDTKGSIEAGKIADLVILDKCPLDVATIDIKDIKVIETIKAGKTIFRNTEFK